MQFKSELPETRYLATDEISGSVEIKCDLDLPTKLKLIMVTMNLSTLSSVQSLISQSKFIGTINAILKPDAPPIAHTELYEYDTNPAEFVKPLISKSNVYLNKDYVLVITEAVQPLIAAKLGRFIIDTFKHSNLLAISPGTINKSVGILSTEPVTDDYKVYPPGYVQGAIAASVARCVQLKLNAKVLIVKSEGAQGFERISSDDLEELNSLICKLLDLPKLEVHETVSKLYL